LQLLVDRSWQHDSYGIDLSFVVPEATEIPMPVGVNPGSLPAGGLQCPEDDQLSEPHPPLEVEDRLAIVRVSGERSSPGKEEGSGLR
jgi:hypothetical protein